MGGDSPLILQLLTFPCSSVRKTTNVQWRESCLSGGNQWPPRALQVSRTAFTDGGELDDPKQFMFTSFGLHEYIQVFFKWEQVFDQWSVCCPLECSQLGRLSIYIDSFIHSFIHSIMNPSPQALSLQLCIPHQRWIKVNLSKVAYGLVQGGEGNKQKIKTQVIYAL